MKHKINSRKKSNSIDSDAGAFEKLITVISYIQSIDKKRLNLTRLLKYLYIIDEKSVLKIGTPITNLTYKVAENGPLADRLWWCILQEPVMFSQYFDIKITHFISGDIENDSCKIYSKGFTPNLDKLSRFEIKVIDATIEKYRGVHTSEIINELHGENTLWGKIIKKYKIDFNKLDSKITTHKIDFSHLIASDELKLQSYQNYLSRQA